VALLMILPLIIIALAWSTPSHTLLYANPGVVDNGSFIAFYAQRGPAFYVHVAYGYILLLVAIVLMARAWRQAEGEARKLAFLVLLGSLVAFFGNIAYQAALLLDLPLYVDLTVLAFLFSIILFAWGWFRFRLADIVPELRELAPVPADADMANLAHNTQLRILNLVSLGLGLLLFVALVPILTLLSREEVSRWPFMAAYVVLFFILVVVALWRSGPYGLRATGLATVYLGLLLLDLRVNGLTPAAGLFMVTYAAFVAILFNRRAAILGLAIGVIGLLSTPPPEVTAPIRDIYSLIYLLLSIFMTIALLLWGLFALRRDSQTLLRRSRELTRTLDVERAQLEQRVAERTRALETSATISRQLSTILDRAELVREVVEQLRVAFAYYHVHIFLWDEASGLLKMAGGTGEAGQAMLVMGHAIAPDQGLVGRAFMTNTPLVVPDVSRDPYWLPNRLLPGTRSEIAVPINYGDEILGVIDAQDSEVNGLGQQDSQLLQTIAGQLAVALRNARLLAQIQQQAEQAALINTINQKIAQTIDMDGAIRVALVELSRALEAGSAAVRLEADGGANGHG
ncbi:MAG TPA: histidine kinase N-terminal 7TM domain-containing protein, partial [Promineifilum sp.]|nr:histidine kinase N-terminal 7TM domain-containing protein [Promineifilum sp.]